MILLMTYSSNRICDNNIKIPRNNIDPETEIIMFDIFFE